MKVGVALGAGGTRGFAHVGVLEALRDHEIPIHCIAGSSIGSVIASLWAYGHDGDEIMAMVAETRRYVVRWTLPLQSLLSNRGIRAHIEKSAAGRTFEDSPIPLGVVATDLRTGQRVLFRDGDVVPAILASSSIPGVFPPVEYRGHLLIDGGVSEPVPAKGVAELGADLVIGVSLGAPAEGAPGYGVVGTLARTIEIMQAVVHEHSCAAADIVIAPDVRAGSAEELRAAGRAAVEQVLPQLRRLVTVAA